MATTGEPHRQKTVGKRPLRLMFRTFTPRHQQHSVLAPRATFRCIWGLVVGLHALNILYLGACGRLYATFARDSAILMYTVELYSISVRREHFPLVAAGYAALAVYHGYLVGGILWHSLRRRRLCFHAETATPQDAGSKSRLASKRQSRIESGKNLSAPPLWWRVLDWVLWQWRRCISPFNVRDPNYGKYYMLRELIQTGLQTQQAYRSSYLVAYGWMNAVVVALLVINCWSTVLIYRIFRSSVPMVRLACLVSNLVLDMITYMFFPLVLFYPYFRDFEPAYGDFPLRFWYTDSWLSQAIPEGQMLFVTSAWDGISKLLIGYNVPRTLATFTSLIGEDAEHTRERRKLTILPTNPMPPTGSGVIKPPGRDIAVVDQRDSVFESLARKVMITWGSVVLVLFAIASTRVTNTNCKVQVRPWFSWQAACSLMEISCRGGDVPSLSAETLDGIISSVEESWVSFLTIRHCQRIELTPSFQRLHSLIGFKVHNSTIGRWDTDAALTATTHPNVMLVFLLDVNMTEIPPGLLHEDFPPKLKDIEISRSNLSSLPADVASVWPKGMFLVLEECQFGDFPLSLVELQPRFLSVALNNFTHIPPGIWEIRDLAILILSGNPFSTFPLTVASVPPLFVLRMEETRINGLPSWMDGTFFSSLVMTRCFSTPLCDQVLLVPSTEPTWGDANASEAELDLWRRHVDCQRVSDPDALRQYPLSNELLYNS